MNLSSYLKSVPQTILEIEGLDAARSIVRIGAMEVRTMPRTFTRACLCLPHVTAVSRLSPNRVRHLTRMTLFKNLEELETSWNICNVFSGR